MVSPQSSPSSRCPLARPLQSFGTKHRLPRHLHSRCSLCARCSAASFPLSTVGGVEWFGTVHLALFVGSGDVCHYAQCPCPSAREHHLNHRFHLRADALFEWRELARKCHPLVLENAWCAHSFHTSHQWFRAALVDGREFARSGA